MQKLLFLFLSVCFLCIGTVELSAQQTQDSTLYIIETVDGNQYVGTIMSQDDQKVEFKTATLGVLNISRDQISTMELARDAFLKEGRFTEENPFSTRYFAGPSAYSLRKGEGFYQNTWVLYNTVSFGVSDNVDIGLGMVPIFLFTLGSGDGVTPIWVTSKVSVPLEKDKVNLAVGGLYLAVLGEDTGPGGGFLYGVTTFGSRDKNVSAGLGWGYGFDAGISSTPTFTLGIMQRYKPKWAFVSENYYIGVDEEGLAILSGGARYLGDKVSIDFGGFTFLLIGGSQDVFPILPWLSVSVPFGR